MIQINGELYEAASSGRPQDESCSGRYGADVVLAISIIRRRLVISNGSDSWIFVT
jgi:hypothetical protein